MDELEKSAEYQQGYKDGFHHYEKTLQMVFKWVTTHTAPIHQMQFLEYILFHDPANRLEKDKETPV